MNVIGEAFAGFAGADEHDFAGDEVMNGAAETGDADTEGIFPEGGGGLFDDPTTAAEPVGELAIGFGDGIAVMAGEDELSAPAEAREDIFGRVLVIGAGDEEIDKLRGPGNGMGGVTEFGLFGEPMAEDPFEEFGFRWKAMPGAGWGVRLAGGIR